MIQVFDTHRVLYKNAQIRAYSKASPTTRIDFFKQDDANIGDIVYTDENGYVCYSSNMQTVQSLKVNEDAIIQVSLDNGVSWPIQWEIEAPASSTPGPLATLTFYDENGDADIYNPLQSDKTLPPYLPADQYVAWNETTVPVDGDDCVIELTRWTKNVIIMPTYNGNNGGNGEYYVTLDCGDCRNGQLFIVQNFKNTHCWIYIDAPGNSRVIKVPSKMSLVVGFYLDSDELLDSFASLLNNSTLTDSSIDDARPRAQRYVYTQTDDNPGNQTLDPESADAPAADSLTLLLASNTATSGDLTLTLPNLTRDGIYNVLVLAHRIDTAVFDINLKIGGSEAVRIHSFSNGDTEADFALQLVRYTTILNQTYIAFVHLSATVDYKAEV